MFAKIHLYQYYLYKCIYGRAVFSRSLQRTLSAARDLQRGASGANFSVFVVGATGTASGKLAPIFFTCRRFSFRESVRGRCSVAGRDGKRARGQDPAAALATRAQRTVNPIYGRMSAQQERGSLLNESMGAHRADATLRPNAYADGGC